MKTRAPGVVMSRTETGLDSLRLPTYIKTREDSVIEKLYKPCLRNSRTYVRGAGYFRSSVFRLMTEDLLNFCINNGKIVLLTSTEWGKDDYETTMKAYADNGIREDLTALLEDPDTVEPARMLCALIQNGNLDLRVAVLRGDIYHKKLGYFQDDNGRVVAFSGSGNETFSALKPFDEGNAESFSICCNWDDESWDKYGKNWKDDLDASLDPNQKGTFPVVKINDLDPEFIGKWEIDTNLESHREQARERHKRLQSKWDEVYGSNGSKQTSTSSNIKQEKPDNDLDGQLRIIENEDLWRKQQKEGLDVWRNNGMRGVLEHATGSGKTITSLIAIKEQTDKGNNAIVLVPSQPLLEQWDEEFEQHLPGVTRSLLGAGNSGEGILNEMRVEGGLVLISTLQSFRNKNVIRKLDRLLNQNTSELMLVVDECHRIGAPSYEGICEMKFPITLGLSATPERQRDEEGTSRIFKLLGPVIHAFSLEDALEADLLSNFDYHVEEADLTHNEQQRYDELRKKIKKLYSFWKNSGTEMPESLEVLIFKSRSIIRNAENKITKAVEIINSNFEQEQHWLVYCGEGMMDEIDNQLTQTMRQKPQRYWSGMNRFQRKESLAQFKARGGIMLAIKCLDEGVDIPAISHGVVLSSSKTKREWIQRRGRLLRKSPGKEKSVIYDVLAFPDSHGEETNFVMDEVKRAYEFSKSCLNSTKTEAKINRIMTEYNISEDDLLLDPERSEDDD
tara:strand:- start:7370 stop:9565 length:2196 start_codon:yes stop_codon:yes gene_type:complete